MKKQQKNTWGSYSTFPARYKVFVNNTCTCSTWATQIMQIINGIK